MKVVGLLELNALLTAIGLAILWGIKGWKSGRELVSELGLGYMIGLASLGTATTVALVAGFGATYATILVLALALGLGGTTVALVRRTPLPRGRGPLPRPAHWIDYLGIVSAAIAVIVALAMLRSVWNQPLVAWDAWSFWVTKAKMIYYFGGIDDSLFRALPAPSYPLFVPALDATVFRFVHGTDVSALAIQNWVLLVGFLTAAASLLGRVARSGIVWLFLAAFLVLPEVVLRWYQLIADWTLDAFFGLTALCVLRWLATRERWVLLVGAFTGAAMLATKREGQLLAACLVLGTLLATFRDRRRAWPLILGGAAAAYAVNIPWRLWWASRNLASDMPDNGLGKLAGYADRILPSFRIVLQLTLEYRMWLLAVPIAVAASLAASRSSDGRRMASFYWGTVVACVVGFMWILWSDPTVPLSTVPALTPIPRAVGSIATLSVVAAPALLRSAPADLTFDVGARSLRQLLRDTVEWIESLPLVRVLAGFVVFEWLAVLALALTVRHNGWVYYQGGDQLWYYTLGWLLGHGQLGPTPVGYGWPALLAPFSLFGGASLVSALPGIVLLNVLVLLPVGILALYGVAARIGGRLFGYWTLLLWVMLPFLGILYTNQGYHQRYTELTLPQSLGLTAMSDFPSMIAAAVSVYFCARVVLARQPTFVDAVAAGAAAGFAIGVKPATTFFLVGPALAFLGRRYLAHAGLFLVGLLPAVITLSVWKERGLGYLPAVGHVAARPFAGLASGAPLLAVGNLGRYFDQLSWHRLATNIDLLREHFWSGHFVIWLFLAGLVGLLRMSPRGFLLVGGAILPFALFKGSYSGSSIEDTTFFRLLMPCFPWFVLAVAALPLLVPRAQHRLRPYVAPPPLLTRRRRLALLGAAFALTAVGPLVAFAAADTSLHGKVAGMAPHESMPIPLDVDLGTTAVQRDGRVTLTWVDQRPAGGAVFYRVWRAARAPGLGRKCSTGSGAPSCSITADDIGATHTTSFTDRPGPGTWVYRVAVAANWLDDPQYGDPYLAGKPVVIRVP